MSCHPQNGGGDDDWGEDVTEEAVQARIEDLSGHVTSLTMNSEMEKTQVERVDSFYKLVEVCVCVCVCNVYINPYNNTVCVKIVPKLTAVVILTISVL